MYSTLRTIRTASSICKPVYKTFNSRIATAAMSTLLKKPVKLALVQLASGMELFSVSSTLELIDAYEQAQTNQRIFSMPEIRCSKLPRLVLRL